MIFPDCHVPTHADWKILRDKNGGKSGLSKVNMGKAFDAFHKAIALKDAVTARTAIATMETAAKTYVAEVTKAKYAKVATVVTGNILGGLKTFAAALDKAETDAAAMRGGVRDEVKKALDQIIADSVKLRTALEKINADTTPLLTKFKDGVPPAQRALVLQLVDGLDKHVQAAYAKGFEIDQMVKFNVGVHGSVQNEFPKEKAAAAFLIERRCSQLEGESRNLKTLRKLAGA